MKTILCIIALLAFTASTADAYVRRTVGGGYVVRGAGVYSGRYAGGHYGYGRGYYGHPVARGAAVAAAAVTAIGWGGGYYGDYGTDDYYGAYAADPVTEAPVDYDAYAAAPVVAAPVYYGAHAAPVVAVPVYYGAYAADPGYYGGGYVNRSYITGRPTLFPRYYGGGW
jgi:hypothetical protein